MELRFKASNRNNRDVFRIFAFKSQSRCSMYIVFACKYVQLFTIILQLFAMFLHDSHSYREEIGTEHSIRIRIAKKFGSPNIPTPRCKKGGKKGVKMQFW